VESKDCVLHWALVFARNHSVVYFEMGSQGVSAAMTGPMMPIRPAIADRIRASFILRWDDIDTLILQRV